MNAEVDSHVCGGPCIIPDHNKPCVFPFEYNGKVYTSCTQDSFEPHFWCGTQYNVTNGAGWGLCSDSCLE